MGRFRLSPIKRTISTIHRVRIIIPKTSLTLKWTAWSFLSNFWRWELCLRLTPSLHLVFLRLLGLFLAASLFVRHFLLHNFLRLTPSLHLCLLGLFLAVSLFVRHFLFHYFLRLTPSLHPIFLRLLGLFLAA